MTINIKFGEKIIIVNARNIEAIEIFRNIVNMEGLSNVGVSKDQVDAPGIIAKLQRALASFSGAQKTEGTQIRLDNLEIPLQGSAYQTYSAYETEINNVLVNKDINLSAVNTEAKEIEDIIVFSREILLRCVATVLSNDNASDKSSKKFIKVIDEFAKGLTNIWSQIGSQHGVFSSNYRTAFSTFLSMHSHRWIVTLSAIVETQSMMHSHKATISAFQNAILSRKKVIMAHIYALTIGKPNNFDDIGPAWIGYSLFTHINKKLEEICRRDRGVNLVKLTNTEANGERLDLATISQNNTYVGGILKKHYEDKKEHNKANYIFSLFSSLNKAEALQFVHNKLEDMIQAVGWTMIVSGCLDFSTLQSEINSFFCDTSKLICDINASGYYDDEKLQIAINMADCKAIPVSDINCNYSMLSEGSPFLENIRNMCAGTIAALLECTKLGIPILSEKGTTNALNYCQNVVCGIETIENHQPQKRIMFFDDSSKQELAAAAASSTPTTNQSEMTRRPVRRERENQTNITP